MRESFYISLFFLSLFFFSINPKFNWTAAIFPPTPSVPISLSAISSVPELIILHTNSIYSAGGLSYLSRHPFSKFNFQTPKTRLCFLFQLGYFSLSSLSELHTRISLDKQSKNQINLTLVFSPRFASFFIPNGFETLVDFLYYSLAQRLCFPRLRGRDTHVKDENENERGVYISTALEPTR